MLWELPGPQSFIRLVEGDLGRSGVCVVACPNSEAPVGITEAIESASIDAGLDPLIAVAPHRSGADLRRWLALQVAAPFAPGREPTVLSLLEDDRVGDRRIVIDARQADPAPFADLCDEWVEASSRRERRLGLVVLVAGSMPSLHSAVAQRWWWGQIKRLDCEVAALRFAQSRRDEALFVAAVAELAGSDLSLAERLAANWNGEASSLDRLLPNGEYTGLDSGDLGAALHAPSPQHLSRWANGEVEVWEGRVRACIQSCADVRGAAETRLLAAQIRSLFPGIENDRQRLIAKCRPWLPFLSLEHDEDYETIEIGRLTYLLESSSGLPPSATRAKQAARALVNLRNDLAHRRIVDKRTLNHRQRLFDSLDQ